MTWPLVIPSTSTWHFSVSQTLAAKKWPKPLALKSPNFWFPGKLLSFHRTKLTLEMMFGSCRDTMDVVKQSAALCLLRLLRTCPEVIPSGEWTSRIIHLLNDQHLGVVTAAASLIEALVKRNTDEYKGCVSLAVSRLSRVSFPY